MRRLWDAINARDYARVAGAIAETCEWTSIGSGRTFRGPEAMVAGLRAFAEAFPDGRGEILHALAADHVVVVEWRMSGTNTGSFEGREPTGRRFERRGCSVAEVRGGKIAAYRDYYDRATLHEQLGLTDPR